MIKFLNRVERTVEASNRIKKNIMEMTTIGYFEEFEVVQCNDALIVTDTKFSLVLESEQDRIYVDNSWNKLSDNTREFLIRHEASHIRLNHFKKVNKIHNLKYSIIGESELEFEADRFAALDMGYDKAISALKEMGRNVESNFEKMVISKRIRNLRANNNLCA